MLLWTLLAAQLTAPAIALQTANDPDRIRKGVSAVGVECGHGLRLGHAARALHAPRVVVDRASALSGWYEVV